MTFARTGRALTTVVVLLALVVAALLVHRARPASSQDAPLEERSEVTANPPVGSTVRPGDRITWRWLLEYESSDDAPYDSFVGATGAIVDESTTTATCTNLEGGNDPPTSVTFGPLPSWAPDLDLWWSTVGFGFPTRCVLVVEAVVDDDVDEVVLEVDGILHELLGAGQTQFVHPVALPTDPTETPEPTPTAGPDQPPEPDPSPSTTTPEPTPTTERRTVEVAG